MEATFKLWLHSARQVVQVVKNGERMLKKDAMGRLAVLEEKDGVGISILVDKCGKIADIDYDDNIKARHNLKEVEQVIDCREMCVIPGLVDSHTHPVWAGDRVHEFTRKLGGANYLDILAEGGGINFTVDHTKEATEDTLLTSLQHRLSKMSQCGTTLMEAKTGYGLDTESEIRLLRVLELSRDSSPIELSVTFCGAHAVPKNMNADAATEAVIYDQLPAIHKLHTERVVRVDSVDVFCENTVFNVEQSERILLKAKSLGFRLNFHGEELSYIGAAEMGARIGAEAISHLEMISMDGIQALARVGTMAVLLPTTAFALRLSSPPARQMIQSGVAVALGSDFNPNAYCFSMPMVMYLACVLFKMTPAECLVASTLNAAASLGKSDLHGSLEVGKKANILVLDCPKWEHLIYQVGGHWEVIRHVIREGSLVHSNRTSGTF